MNKQVLLFAGTVLLNMGILYGGNELTQIQLIKDGVNSVDKLANATSITITPDGKYVYAASYGDRAIAIFSRYELTGQLTYTGYFGLN